MIEFYRTRTQDDAHAVVGREMREASDLDEAIGTARALLLTLDMPQHPDAMSIIDSHGGRLYSIQLGANDNRHESMPPLNGCTGDPEVEVPAVVACESECGASGVGSTDHQHGCRVDRDGSSSIHHVFAGVPVVIQSRRISLNRRSEGQRANTGHRSAIWPTAEADGG